MKKGDPGPKIIELVIIASSFGGVEANTIVLSHLPAQITPAIILLTHLTENSETTYAEVLEHKTGHTINIAQDKSPVQAGHIYLAPGGYHLLIEDDKTFALSEDEKIHNVRPSADVLFESIAYNYKERVIAVILTGANQDGAAGLKSICDQGGKCIIQSPESARAKNMPQAALDACRDCQISSINKIAEKILDLISQK
ncbi:MAG: chemotaxis protein CheB [gamma proteobacterium symbiont of Taylorina sp.]|nr:chemotaxis protein CheB [gamma proteobacterium symbiont of Taylorina sp.]